MYFDHGGEIVRNRKVIVPLTVLADWYGSQAARVGRVRRVIADVAIQIARVWADQLPIVSEPPTDAIAVDHGLILAIGCRCQA